MKIGLLSDIHADYEALRIVLERFEQVHQVDRVLCAGDLCGYGPQPNEVIAFFRQSNIVTVRGNHDAPSSDLEPANADYLRALPLGWNETCAGKHLFMCHGIPNVNMVGFTPALLERESVREMMREIHADIIIAGHTHEILCLQVEQTWILNPGSVYARSNEGTTHSYAILDLTESIFTVFDLLMPIDQGPLHVFSLTHNPQSL